MGRGITSNPKMHMSSHNQNICHLRFIDGVRGSLCCLPALTPTQLLYTDDYPSLLYLSLGWIQFQTKTQPFVPQPSTSTLNTTSICVCLLAYRHESLPLRVTCDARCSCSTVAPPCSFVVFLLKAQPFTDNNTSNLPFVAFHPNCCGSAYSVASFSLRETSWKESQNWAK